LFPPESVRQIIDFAAVSLHPSFYPVRAIVRACTTLDRGVIHVSSSRRQWPWRLISLRVRQMWLSRAKIWRHIMRVLMKVSMATDEANRLVKAGKLEETIKSPQRRH
jgi:hypothetical protein